MARSTSSSSSSSPAGRLVDPVIEVPIPVDLKGGKGKTKLSVAGCSRSSRRRPAVRSRSAAPRCGARSAHPTPPPARRSSPIHSPLVCRSARPAAAVLRSACPVWRFPLPKASLSFLPLRDGATPARVAPSSLSLRSSHDARPIDARSLSLVLTVLPPSGAGDSTPAEIACRKALARQRPQDRATILKEATNVTAPACGADPARSPRRPTATTSPSSLEVLNKILKAENKLALSADATCATFGYTPASLGYVACSAPCDTIGITGFAAPTASRLVSSARRGAASAPRRGGLRHLPRPADPRPEQLRAPLSAQIGKELVRQQSTRMREQQKCQTLKDKGKPAADPCHRLPHGRPEGQGRKGRKQGGARSRRSAPTSMLANTLTSCGATFIDETTCLIATAADAADELFFQVYEPPMPATPTPDHDGDAARRRRPRSSPRR